MCNYVHLANNKPFCNDSNASIVFSLGIILRNHSMKSLKENAASCFFEMASDPKAGAAGSALNLLEFPTLNHRCEITRGVREPECRALLQTFFANQRKDKE